MRAARIDACSLANNHTLDFEEQGLLDTMNHLDAAGIRHTGAGRNQLEAADPAILTVPTEHTHRVALLAFTDNEPPFAAGTDRPGTNYLPVSLRPDDLRWVEKAVSAVRGKEIDTVVFSNHWGPNMVQRPAAARAAWGRKGTPRRPGWRGKGHALAGPSFRRS